MLSKRLAKVADLINDVALVADIGTDHAYLPIFLVKSNKTKQALAVDVNQEPLSWAQKNIVAYQCADRVKTILSDGLAFLSTQDLALDVVTICGLGSATILQIMQFPTTSVSKFIICSNTDISNIRQWCFDYQLSISHEDFFTDYAKFYWLAVIERNQQRLVQKSHISLGDAYFFKNNLAYQTYLKADLDKFAKIIASMDVGKHHEKISAINDEQIAKEKFIDAIK